MLFPVNVSKQRQWNRRFAMAGLSEWARQHGVTFPVGLIAQIEEAERVNDFETAGV